MLGIVPGTGPCDADSFASDTGDKDTVAMEASTVADAPGAAVTVDFLSSRGIGAAAVSAGAAILAGEAGPQKSAFAKWRLTISRPVLSHSPAKSAEPPGR